MASSRAEQQMEISPELAKDLNYRAYQNALKNGELNHLPEGMWVAFNKGELCATNAEENELLQHLHENGIEGSLIQQVGVSENIAHLRSPRIL